MRLFCRLGRHRAKPMPKWNGGYYFSQCRRCGVDLIRACFGRWEEPDGFRVVWKPATRLDQLIAADTGHGQAREEQPPAAQAPSGNDGRVAVFSAPQMIADGSDARPEDSDANASLSVHLAPTGAGPSGFAPVADRLSEPSLAQSRSSDDAQIDGAIIGHLQAAEGGKSSDEHGSLSASGPTPEPGLRPDLETANDNSDLEASLAVDGMPQPVGPNIPFEDRAGSPPANPDFMEEDGQSAWDSMMAGGERDRGQCEAVGHDAGAGHETLSRPLAARGGDKAAATAAAAD
jgi:hypothetical protein